jgi:dienelactone hydrolase
MAEVVLFHHAQGLTEGVLAFAERLRAGGHQVTVPDLFDGATFGDLEEGVAHAEAIGFEEVIARGVAAVTDLPDALVYGGFSMGVLPAQELVRARPGARAALLYEGGAPLSAFGGAWPDGVPLQIHARPADPWAEVEVLEGLAHAVPGATLHRYPGSAHLFTDASLGAYDPAATDRVIERTLVLLRTLG